MLRAVCLRKVTEKASEMAGPGREARSGRGGHPEWVWLGLILALGLGLRLIRLGAWPFWHDEVHNLLLTEELGATLRGDRVSNHPPLFTILLTAWRAIGLGYDEGSLRLLPALLGVCSIGAVYLAARRLVDARTGLVAAFLVAISPLHLTHSQDLKEYMVLPVSAPVMVYYLYRATEENRRRLWFLYGLWAGIACYSELFVAPLLVAVNLWFLLRTKVWSDRFRPWLLANLFGAALFLPQLGVMLGKARGILLETEEYWVPRPTLVHAAFYVKALAFGYSDLEPHFKVALAVYALLAAAGLWAAWRRNRWAAVLLGMWFAVPVGIVFAASHVTQSFFLIRAMLPYGLGFYILVAAAVAALRPRALRGAALVGLAVLASFSLAQRYRGEYPPREFPHRPGVHPPVAYDEAIPYIVERWRDGDAVVHASGSTWFSAMWYGLGERVGHGISPDQWFADFVHRSNPDVTQRPLYMQYFPHNPQTLLAEKDRVWFIFAEWEREYLEGNAMACWRWLESHRTELAHARFRGMEVFLYGRTLDGEPVEETARLSDDGASAEVRYRAGGGAYRYVKIDPDSGLFPRRVEERRGRLRLRFEDESAAFVVENASDEAVSCIVEAVASNGLIAGASLEESHPESDYWHVGPMTNPAPPPASYELPTFAAGVHGEAPETLVGTLPVEPGRHELIVRTLGRAGLRMRMGDDVFWSGGGPDAAGWRWWRAGHVEVGANTRAPLEIKALPPDTGGADRVELGYIAWRQAETGAAGSEVPVWPGTVIVPAGGSLRWAPAMADARRLDVWVYESGAEGQAYWIFRRFGAESAEGTEEK